MVTYSVDAKTACRTQKMKNYEVCVFNTINFINWSKHLWKQFSNIELFKSHKKYLHEYLISILIKGNVSLLICAPVDKGRGKLSHLEICKFRYG